MSRDELAQPHRSFVVQRDRLLIAFLYGAGLLLIGYFAHGGVPPPFTVEGLWFYGAFIPLLVARLIEPWFARPADALANGLAVLVATAALTPADTALSREQLDLGRTTLALYASAVLIFAGVAVLGRTEGGLLGWAAPPAARIAGAVGQAQVSFSLYLLLVALAGNAGNSVALALIAVGWVIVILVRPLEWLALQLRALRPMLPHPAGVVVQEIVDPRLLLATVAEESGVEVGTSVEWTSGARGHVVDRTELLPRPRLLIALETPSRKIAGNGRVGDATRSVIGYVAESSSIPELVARTSAASAGTSGVAEGRLLSAPIRGRETLFQVTSAAVDERVEWGIRRNLVSVKARKLGIWNQDEQGFDQVPWLADPGAAVRSKRPDWIATQFSGSGDCPEPPIR